MNALHVLATLHWVLPRAFALPGPLRPTGQPPGAIRRRRRRAMGLLALLVFTGGWASSAAAALDCPHHSPVPADATPAAHAGHVEHAAPAAGPAAAEAEHPHPSSHHEGPCTCLGDCAGASAIRSVETPAVERVREALPLRAPSAEPLFFPARSHLPHVLPWPTAPPHA